MHVQTSLYRGKKMYGYHPSRNQCTAQSPADRPSALGRNALAAQRCAVARHRPAGRLGLAPDWATGTENGDQRLRGSLQQRKCHSDAARPGWMRSEPHSCRTRVVNPAAVPKAYGATQRMASCIQCVQPSSYGDALQNWSRSGWKTENLLGGRVAVGRICSRATLAVFIVRTLQPRKPDKKLCGSYFFAFGMDIFDIDMHIGLPRVRAYKCVHVCTCIYSKYIIYNIYTYNIYI